METATWVRTCFNKKEGVRYCVWLAPEVDDLKKVFTDLDISWESMMEVEETVLQAVLRETHEEVGADLRIRPLGTVHVSAFHYDERIRYMLSIGYLLAYDGGTIQPGDDMLGSEYRWWSLDELASPKVKLLIPPGEKWLIKRAVDLYRMWNIKNATVPSGFDLSVRGKTKD